MTVSEPPLAVLMQVIYVYEYNNENEVISKSERPTNYGPELLANELY